MNKLLWTILLGISLLIPNYQAGRITRKQVKSKFLQRCWQNKAREIIRKKVFLTPLLIKKLILYKFYF